MNAVQWFVHDKLQRLASDARAAAAQVQRAQSLREVRGLGRVHADPTVTSLRHMVPELRRLNQACEQRAQALVDTQLGSLRALKEKDAQAFATEASRLMQHEWPFLRGSLASVYVHAQRELAKLRV